MKAAMKKCITHHYACDCREEKFKEILSAAQIGLAYLESDYLGRKLAAKLGGLTNKKITEIKNKIARAEKTL
jgi:hypothetical protein